MESSSLFKLFDATVERPRSFSAFLGTLLRWRFLLFVLAILSLVSILLVFPFVDDYQKAYAVSTWVRAGLILVLCCFMVYATYRNAVEKHKREKGAHREEDEQLWKEIAAYYKKEQGIRDKE